MNANNQIVVAGSSRTEGRVVLGWGELVIRQTDEATTLEIISDGAQFRIMPGEYQQGKFPRQVLRIQDLPGL